MPLTDIPLWRRDMRTPEGARIRAIDFYNRFYRGLHEQGLLTSTMLREHDAGFYNALAKTAARDEKSLGDFMRIERIPIKGEDPQSLRLNQMERSRTRMGRSRARKIATEAVRDLHPHRRP